MKHLISFFTLTVFSVTLLIVAVRRTEAVLGARCSSNSQCDETGNNEYCGNDFGFEPRCGEGFCECKPCYIRNTYGLCVRKRYVSQLYAPCNSSVDEVITIPKAQCNDRRVQCHPSTFMDGNRCRTNLTCNSRIGGIPGQYCPQGTICGRENRCICTEGTKWDYSKERCVPKEFGDPCSYNKECDYPHAGKSDDYNLLGYIAPGQAQCRNERCNCPEFGYKTTGVGYFDENGEYRVKVICVSRSTATDMSDGSCMLDPIRGSNFVNNICGSNKICAKCPLENTPTGSCRSVRGSSPSSDYRCYSAATSLTSGSIALTVIFTLVSALIF